MNADNPYSSPVDDSAEATSVSTAPESLGNIARATFLAWEKLRLIYIAVLAVFTLLLGMPLLGSVRFWMTVVGGAVVANLCYFAGPIVETYIVWLGFRAAWVRIVLFVLGTLFSCILAFATVAGQLIPNMD